MRQALHIFKKDVRHLRFEIAIVLIVTAAFAFVSARRAFWLDDPGANRGPAWMMSQFLLPLAWWILIVRVIHTETLPGDRQFWITRPYEWKSLLGAKLLFIAAFVNLPLLAADVMIIGAYGFRPWAEIPGLLWRQVLCSVVFLLPVAVVCAVTSGLVQLLSAGFVVFVAVLVWSTALPGTTPGGSWGALDWVTLYYAILVAALAALPILIWQYAARKTWAARGVAAGAAIVAMLGGTLIPWTSAFAIQSRLSKQRFDVLAMHVEFDWERKWLARARVDRDEKQVQIELPLRITGMPAGMDAKPDGLVMAIEAPDGAVWRTTRKPWAQVSADRFLSLYSDVDAAFYRKVKDVPVKLRGTFYFTVYGNSLATNIPSNSRYVAVPRMGRCAASGPTGGDGYFLLCGSAFRWEPALVIARFVEPGKHAVNGIASHPLRRLQPLSYSPFPADLDINPVSQFFSWTTSPTKLSEVVIQSEEPLAHVKREFEIDGLRLGEFEVKPTSVLR